MDNSTQIVAAPSEPPRGFRRTQIAVSVYFGVLAIAMCFLWVASVQNAVTLSGKLPGHYDFSIQSLHGGCSLHTHPTISPWALQLSEADRMVTADGFAVDHPYVFFHYQLRSDGWSFNAPVWVPLTFSGFLAVACWFPNNGPKFSLRTMLVSTTLVAVVLGLGVWLGR